MIPPEGFLLPAIFARSLREGDMCLRGAVVLLLFLIGGCAPVLTEDEARSLANQRLRDYAVAEQLDLALFSQPVLSSAPNHPWIFDYTSNTEPRHSIRIYVNSRDTIEIHRMLEE